MGIKVLRPTGILRRKRDLRKGVRPEKLLRAITAWKKRVGLDIAGFSQLLREGVLANSNKGEIRTLKKKRRRKSNQGGMLGLGFGEFPIFVQEGGVGRKVLEKGESKKRIPVMELRRKRKTVHLT